MSTLVIVLIILLGMFLLILEFFVFPGVTVAGIGGLIFTAGGIFLAYDKFGSTGGHVALVSTMFVGVLMLVLSFRAGTWKRLMLDSSIKGQVETVEANMVKEGDEGVAVTRLNPIGKVQINNLLMEGKCPGHFVDENTEVIVQKVLKHTLLLNQKIKIKWQE